MWCACVNIPLSYPLNNYYMHTFRKFVEAPDVYYGRGGKQYERDRKARLRSAKPATRPAPSQTGANGPMPSPLNPPVPTTVDQFRIYAASVWNALQQITSEHGPLDAEWERVPFRALSSEQHQHVSTVLSRVSMPDETNLMGMAFFLTGEPRTRAANMRGKSSIWANMNAMVLVLFSANTSTIVLVPTLDNPARVLTYRGTMALIRLKQAVEKSLQVVSSYDDRN